MHWCDVQVLTMTTTKNKQTNKKNNERHGTFRYNERFRDKTIDTQKSNESPSNQLTELASQLQAIPRNVMRCQVIDLENLQVSDLSHEELSSCKVKVLTLHAEAQDSNQLGHSNFLITPLPCIVIAQSSIHRKIYSKSKTATVNEIINYYLTECLRLEKNEYEN